MPTPALMELLRGLGVELVPADHGGYVRQAVSAHSTQKAAIEAAMLARLHQVFPELGGMQIHHRVRQVRWDFPSHPVGEGERRPHPLTPVPGLLLAGDFVRTPVPAALMEGAIVSGTVAANAILRSAGHPTEEIWSVPPAGVLRRGSAGRGRAA